MTADEFIERFGVEPWQDDLERVNCQQSGHIGHGTCGLCEHGLPRFWACRQCLDARLERARASLARES